MSETPTAAARIDVPQIKRLETFSYLPGMDATEIRGQIAYMLAQGWVCAVEHVTPALAAESYWTMWTLPMFGEQDVDAIMNELNACHNTHPGDHVRLVGYDQKRQTLGLSMVVYRGDA